MSYPPPLNWRLAELLRVSDWTETTLGKLCKFQAGDAFPKDKQGITVGEYPFIKVSDMNLPGNERLIQRSNNWIRKADASKYRLHPPGSVVFAKIGEALRANRRRVLVRETIIDNNMMSASPLSGINPAFLLYVLDGINFNDISRGSALPYLAAGDLNKLAVKIPGPETQQAIADTLSLLDRKIELNRRMNETLEGMAQAIFRDWFVDFGPVRRKAAGEADPVAIMGGLTPDPARAAPLAALFPAAFGNDGLPVGWRRMRLSEIASQGKGSVNPQGQPDTTFEHYSLPSYDKGQEPSQDAGSSIKSNKVPVPLGAVLLSKLNPEIMRVWLPNDPAGTPQIASTEFLVFVANAAASRALLFALFRDPDFRTLMQGMVTGTSKSHQRISPPALLAQEIIAADPSVFPEFEAVVGPMLGRILAGRAENRTLAETRDYLLPRLMSGAVRVVPRAAAG
jgi:type I restriction enzyme S subunit